MDEFLSSRELFALIEVMIGARAFSRMELLALVEKLKHFSTTRDSQLLHELIRREMYHYAEVNHDCESVTENLWHLTNCIEEQKEISIDYYRMDRTRVMRRIMPASVMFADHYFYLIAFRSDDDLDTPYYFRIDRITHIMEHKKRSKQLNCPEFDEGLLRKRSLFMWPGKLRTIRFEYSGPSVRAVLDKLPTSEIIERKKGGVYLLEAEVYGDGIRMWLLSQGSWVKVLSPKEFVEEMQTEIDKMSAIYE